MRFRAIIILCVALFLTLQCSVFAQQATKYLQPPKEAESHSFASSSFNGTGYISADDWVCPDGLPIVGISWWGAYWQAPSTVPSFYSDGLPNASPVPLTFSVYVVKDLPAGDPANPYPFSRPANLSDAGSVLWYGSSTNYSEVFAFQSVKQNPDGSPIAHDVYKYSIDISGNPFNQVLGEKYWLMIHGVSSDAATQWGWHESSARVGSYAVQSFVTGEQEFEWLIPCGGRDLAFELTVIPEPTSVLVLGAGLSGLVGFVIRRRR